MYDAIFLATIVAFFALCVAYIRACDRIIGPDSEFELERRRPRTSRSPAERWSRRHEPPRRVSAADNFTALGLTFVLLVYLVLVLVFPERF